MTTVKRPINLACASILSLLGATSVVCAETTPVAGTAVSSELTGTVTVVNQEQRMLTIETPDGHFEVLHVPDEVQRLDDIKIGNKLTITETDLILVDLHKGADAGQSHHVFLIFEILAGDDVGEVFGASKISLLR